MALLPDLTTLSRRTVLITGATSGIGRAVADAAAEHGARVILAVRNLEAGRAVASALDGGLDRHLVAHVDLADLSSVHRLGATVTEPIDILVNNAGVSCQRLERTTDGFEMQFGTNHLGHFALTALLLPRVSGRIVTVASQAERAARLEFDDLNWTRRPYRASRAYADSKLANVLFTAELTRRLQQQKSSVTAFAAHPGLVKTAIYSRTADDKVGLWDRLVPVLGQSSAAGAQPVLLAMTADLPPGTFTGPRHWGHMRGAAQPIGRSARARNHDLARRLWTMSEDMTSVSMPT